MLSLRIFDPNQPVIEVDHDIKVAYKVPPQDELIGFVLIIHYQEAHPKMSSDLWSVQSHRLLPDWQLPV